MRLSRHFISGETTNSALLVARVRLVSPQTVTSPAGRDDSLMTGGDGGPAWTGHFEIGIVAGVQKYLLPRRLGEFGGTCTTRLMLERFARLLFAVARILLGQATNEPPYRAAGATLHRLSTRGKTHGSVGGAPGLLGESARSARAIRVLWRSFEVAARPSPLYLHLLFHFAYRAPVARLDDLACLQKDSSGSSAHSQCPVNRSNAKMFTRRTTQKPPAELYETFRSKFSGLGQSTSSADTSQVAPGATALSNDAPGGLPGSTAGVSQSQDVKALNLCELQNAEPTPRASNEPWSFGSTGLTPSFLDPGNQGFNFANHLSGYYTPTPGGTNTIFHPTAGDLHTPSYHMGLGTPLSMPTSEGAMNGGLHAGHAAAAFNGFHPHMQNHFQPPQQHHFQNLNPFQIHQLHTQPQQQTFAPHQLSHQPSFDQGPMEDSPIGDISLDLDTAQHSQQQSPELLFHPQSFHQSMPPPSFHPNGEKFRFHATLNAPTAMIKHSDEIPITYLNKGQAYTLNVVDTRMQQPIAPLKYRTFVRVSFEDEQQRRKPAACWQLWKEGRGTNEAHQRGGRLQAVEYVDSAPATGTEDPSKPRVELESASFDGFCVTWTPPAGGSECPIAVRFNFLSTDFSHSKGVKGIPVRLCAKTEVVADLSSNSKPSPDPEVCFCKVKLFRDHGAERKLSNDVAHVKKTMEKMNQQIAQIESGMRDNSKRKRSGSFAAKAGIMDRPGKVPKHRRTWSVDSTATTGARGSAEEDLQMKLMTLQDMFSSTRPASVLYLRGAEEDDPDLHPVKMSGENDQAKSESIDNAWDRQSTQNGDSLSLVSPTPSNRSLGESRRDSTLQQPTPYAGVSRVNSSEWRAQPQTAISDIKVSAPQQLASPPENQPIKIQTRSPKSGAISGWVEAVGIDTNYQPPPERVVKPAACVYVQPRFASKPPKDNYHRAVYLMNRTYKDFINAIGLKCDVEPTSIVRTVRISQNGLQVLFDDDCVRELPEGQDMTAEFAEVEESPGMASHAWDDVDLQCDGDLSGINNITTSGYELRLLF
ncbi:hypothetical protein Q7P37_006830 [Cladosporium fusiforme]